MIVASPNLGIRGVGKHFVRGGGQYSMQINIGETTGKEVRTVNPLGLGWGQNFNVVANNYGFGNCWLNQVQGEIEVLDSPFDQALSDYFHRNIAIAAIFYDIKHGSLTELNKAIGVVESTQLLNTPFFVCGDESDIEHIDQYRFLDFYTRVTNHALERKISDTQRQWDDNIFDLRESLYHGWSLLLSLHARDNYSAAHSLGAGSFAYLAGDRLGLTPLELELLMIGAIFYDLGMIGVADNILNKADKLDHDEIARIRGHTGRVVRYTSYLTRRFGLYFGGTIEQLGKYHHRHYAGLGGYPAAEEDLSHEIDLGKVSYLVPFISIGDAFDSMITRRPYRGEASLAERKEDLVNGMGGQFDPVAAQALLELLEEGIAVETQIESPWTNGDLLAETKAERQDYTATSKEIVEIKRRQSHLAVLGEFTAMMAHEINNYLAMLSGSQYYLQELPLRLRGIARTIAKGDLSPLTDLLSLSKEAEEHNAGFKAAFEGIRLIARSCLDLGRLNIEQEIFSPNEVFNIVESFIKARFKEKTFNLEFDLAESVPALLGNKQNFMQIILNLLINAIQAIPAGGEVAVTSEEKNGMVFITVSDNGTGIPEDIQTLIFEPFFTTKSAEEGTGLGLPIVKTAVEEMGGTIEFTSEVGKGTTFILKFPL